MRTNELEEVIEYNITQNKYTDTYNLRPDVCYNYVVIPYNGDDLSGIPYYFNYNKYTLGEVKESEYNSLSTNSLRMIFYGSYYYVNVLRNDNVEYNDIFDNSFTDLNVIPNTIYSYSLIPINEEYISGTHFITKEICTLSVITDLLFLDVSTSQISVSFSGYFSYYDLFRVDLNNCRDPDNPNLILMPDLTSYVFLEQSINVANFESGIFIDYSYNMIPNNPYSYIVRPYNKSGVFGELFYGNKLTFTLAKLHTSSLIYAKADSISINYTGDFNFVTITRNIYKNNKYEFDKLYYGIFTNEFIDTQNILPKTYYQYKIIPYNANDIPSTDISSVQIINNIYTEPLITSCDLVYGNNSITLSISGIYDQVQIARFSIDYYNADATSVVVDFISYGYGQNSLTGSNNSSYDISYVNHIKIADISINTIINNSSVVNDFYKNFNLIYNPELNISYYDIGNNASFSPPTFNNWFFYDISNILNYIDISIPFDNARVTYGIIPFILDYRNNNKPIIGAQYSTNTVTFARNTSL